MKRSGLALLLICTAALYAKEPSRNHEGVLLRMLSVPCGAPDSNPFASAVLGGQGSTQTGEQEFCPEYVLRSEGLLYRIRQCNNKNQDLLPIGGKAQFRIEKYRLVLQVEDFGDKTYEFLVMAVIPEGHGDELRKEVDSPRSSQ